MAEVALLNPAEEGRAMRAQLDTVRAFLGEREKRLITQWLTEKEYSATLGATIALRQLLDRLEDDYRRMIHK